MTTQRDISVYYSSVDDMTPRKRKYKTLAGAQKYAQDMVGKHPEFGRNYAVSFDGVGKIEVEGATLEELFPPEPKPPVDDDYPPEDYRPDPGYWIGPEDPPYH